VSIVMNSKRNGYQIVYAAKNATHAAYASHLASVNVQDR